MRFSPSTTHTLPLSLFVLGFILLSGCNLTTKNSPIVTPVASDWINRFFSQRVCELPCWEGITPGHTTITEAFELLSKNPTYTNVSVPTIVAYSIQEYSEMNWGTTSGNGGGLAWSKKEDGYVSEIFLGLQKESPKIQLGQLITAFGEPDNVIITEERENICVGQIFYVKKGMELLIFGRCKNRNLSLYSKSEIDNIILLPIDVPGFPDENYWVTGNKEFVVDWVGYGKYPITNRLSNR